MKSINIIKYGIFNQIPWLVHGYSTRLGGVSSGRFSSMNLGPGTTDDPHAVQENRRRFFSELGIRESRLAVPRQVHSAKIVIVDRPGIYGNCDALITQRKDVFLTVQTADCFAVGLCDPVARVVAMVHSGWRGTSQNITGKIISQMIDLFDCRPENLKVVLGPGIQQKNYQVDENTARLFSAMYCRPDGPGHFKLDVQAAIRDQILAWGLSRDQIETDGRCTFEESELFYSYRRDGNFSGRMIAVIGMPAD